MNNRKLLIKILIIPVVLLLSGCTHKEAEKTHTIKIAFWGDIYNATFAQKMVDIYKQRVSSVKIEVLPIGQEYTSKLLTMIAGGTPPDIMLLEPYQLVEFADKGVLLALTKFEEDKEFQQLKDDMWSDLSNAIRYKDVPYGVPIWSNIIALFYNKALLKQAGLPWPDDSWSLNEFSEAARRLTIDADNDGRMEQFGFSGSSIGLNVNSWDIYIFIRENGINLYNENQTECLIDQPEVIESIRWYLDLLRIHRVSPTDKDIATGQLGRSGEEIFKTGKVAMIMGGRWYLRTLSETKNLGYGVTPWPRGKIRFMVSIPVFLGISAKSKYPDECWNFLKFMMGKEGQEEIALGRSEIPILKSIANSSAFLNQYGRVNENKMFLDGLQNTEAVCYILGERPWKDEIQRKFELVVRGKMELDKACQEIALEYKKIVKKNDELE